MAERTTVGGLDPGVDPPSQVQVTVVPGPRRRPPITDRLGVGVTRARLRGRTAIAATVAAALLVAGAFAIAVIATGSSPHHARVPARVAARTPSARVPARNPFLPYNLHATAILHKVHGRWRLIRILAGTQCPVVPRSEVGRSDVIVCELTSDLRKIP